MKFPACCFIFYICVRSFISLQEYKHLCYQCSNPSFLHAICLLVLLSYEMLKTSTPLFSRHLITTVTHITTRASLFYGNRTIYRAAPRMVHSTAPINSASHIQKPLPNDYAGQNIQRFREFDLQGKVFAVTGGGRGLGLTLAEALVEAGGQGN